MLYGLLIEPYNGAIDQHAWEMSLTQVAAEGNYSYDHLIHYPHEGGTIFISLLGILVKHITGIKVLSFLAVLLDLVSRLIQLAVVKHVFSRKTYLLFAFWTIAALPSLLPWGTVNFGLHHISSCFPFILLWLVYKQKNTKKEAVTMGLFLSCALWFSYINIVLIAAFIAYQIIEKKVWKHYIYTWLSCAIVLSIHIIVRMSFDAGFHLGDYGLSSVRGLGIDNFGNILNLATVSILPLGGSTMIAASYKIVGIGLKSLWLIAFYWAMGILLKGYRSLRESSILLIGLLIVFIFMILYALSPFYQSSMLLKSFVAYRHFSYILPLICLLVILGLSQLKKTSNAATYFIALCALGSVISFLQPTLTNKPIEPIGWVLAGKYGHTPDVVERAVQLSNLDQEKLHIGIGWGTATALFEKTVGGEKLIENRIGYLHTLLQQYPEEFHDALYKGVVFAFSDQVKPRLDTSILNRIQQYALK